MENPMENPSGKATHSQNGLIYMGSPRESTRGIPKQMALYKREGRTRARGGEGVQEKRRQEYYSTRYTTGRTLLVQEKAYSTRYTTGRTLLVQEKAGGRGSCLLKFNFFSGQFLELKAWRGKFTCMVVIRARRPGHRMIELCASYSENL